MSPEEIAAAIAAAPDEAVPDPDSPPTRPEDWEDVVFVPGGGYPAVKAALDERRHTRGSQKAPPKEAVSIGLSPKVVAFFKAGGPGWQTRIDAVLREDVETHR
ncbi:BrnA antitoxin family protein [Thioalkalicoccus limnaeus]|uniref:BrnA antitoxin family protein n=1 Tax=Thioalkalicoccus limnaeus TaxID=120681 RepID=A0ABV4BJV4_9GAMM